MKSICKKAAVLGLTLMMALGMAACGGSSSGKAETQAPATQAPAAGGDETYSVGVGIPGCDQRGTWRCGNI